MKNYFTKKAEVEIRDIINLAAGIEKPASDSIVEANINLLLAKLVALQETISKI